MTRPVSKFFFFRWMHLETQKHDRSSANGMNTKPDNSHNATDEQQEKDETSNHNAHNGTRRRPCTTPHSVQTK
jgi:hypothetical protein